MTTIETEQAKKLKQAMYAMIACGVMVLLFTATVVLQYTKLQENKKALAQNFTVVQEWTEKYTAERAQTQSCLTMLADTYVTWGLDKIYTEQDAAAVFKYTSIGEDIRKLQMQFLAGGSK